MLSRTSTAKNQKSKNKKLFKQSFNHFTVHQPGLLQNGNMLLLIDFSIKDEVDQNFGTLLCDKLEEIGVHINEYLTIIVDSMENEELILRLIRNYSGIKYFLMIGEKPHCNAIMKSIKLKTDIRGNYKDYRKIIHDDIFPLCLEINKQCRGINYPCPANFPRDTAFTHFILKDRKVSCATNATKFEEPHVMLVCTINNKTTFIETLEKICSKLTGKLENKHLKNFIVTFENYFSSKMSEGIAEEMYQVVSKWIAFAKIGVAELFLEKTGIWKNKIERCEVFRYDNGWDFKAEGNDYELDSAKIMELLDLCRKCNDLGLNINEETCLPEYVRLCYINYKNVTQNYNNFPVKINDVESDCECDVPELLVFIYPKIKLRNRVIDVGDDDFALA